MRSASKPLPFLLVLLLAVPTAGAEGYRRLGTEFEAMRTVQVPQSTKDQSPKPVAVVEFLHHGLVKQAKPGDPTSVNIVVVTKTGTVAPMRLLQLGPGDFCRIAFEPIPRQTHYELYYGGEPPSPTLLPKWSNETGLLFESREYKHCNLRQLDSVRDAFNAAVPIGADYVPSVFHSCNPTDVQIRPFLSRYSGKLHIKEPGEYVFWTSSQDASFLVINGKEVVSAPGRHRPMRRARRDRKGAARFEEAGSYDFEYYHAATGNQAMMAVAWARGPYDKKNRPASLPPEAFRSNLILRVEPGPVTMRLQRLVPDFEYRALGDVPLPGNSKPLIGVSFRNRSLPAVTMGAKGVRWDFGDGQTSTEANPSHVFLKPGLYTVSLSVKRGSRNVTMTNRIQIDRPYRDRNTKQKAHELEDYLPVLTQYDPATLDPSSARQLALAYQFMSKRIEDRGQKTEDNQKKPKITKQQWLQKAVEVGRVNLKASTEPDDQANYELALLTGSIARFDLGDSGRALAIYRLASRPQKIKTRNPRTECAIRAADIAINELGDNKTALTMLTAAAADLGMKDLLDQVQAADKAKSPPFPAKSGDLAAQFFRVLGDYAASQGKGPMAATAYQAAGTILHGNQFTQVKTTARRGAFSRSTEQFLKDRQLDRAAREIATWCETFPDEKLDGYYTLLYARLLFARGRFEQVVGQCDQLSTVNSDSPYLDQLLLLASEAQQRLGHPDRATALLRELIDTHPGSPLVPEAKKRLK
ncbi:MAG: PKD domain-containing protein [Planctomycetia bacterium]